VDKKEERSRGNEEFKIKNVKKENQKQQIIRLMADRS
jgi:hypothetical protein